jgi:hypothetical protein
MILKDKVAVIYQAAAAPRERLFARGTGGKSCA